MKNKKETIASFGEKEYVNAMRKAAREEEIEKHGRPTTFRSLLYRSKKTYTRKRKHRNNTD